MKIIRKSRSVTKSQKPPVLKFLLLLFCIDLSCVLIAQILFLIRLWNIGNQSFFCVAVGIEMFFLLLQCLTIFFIARSRLSGKVLKMNLLYEFEKKKFRIFQTDTFLERSETVVSVNTL